VLNRWSGYEFRNGQNVKNRVVVPPMASQTAGENGYVTDKTVEHYHMLAKSGAGLIFVEYTYTHKNGRGELNQLAIDQDGQVPGLKKLNEVIKQSGALSGLQMVHVGSKTTFNLIGEQPLAPSAIAVPVKNVNLETPRAVSVEEIGELVEQYFYAASRAYAAGFDVVELHAAHGYGLNQWLSPLTNQRLDEYGGSQKKRSRILYETVEKIKNKFPKKLLSVRLPAEDHHLGGLSFTDMSETVLGLEGLGVDILNVSSGIGGWRRLNGQREEGYLVPDATRVKEITSLPVIGVGGIKSGRYIDQELKQGNLDFAAVGRAVLDSPLVWKTRQMDK